MRKRERTRVCDGGGGEGGAADINNNYWFEPLSVRDLSNLKITSEINYVRLISPGPPIGTQTRVSHGRGSLRSRMCMRPPRSHLPRYPLRHLCLASLLLRPVPHPLYPLVFSSPRITKSAPAHTLAYRRYYVKRSAVYKGWILPPPSPSRGSTSSRSRFSVLIMGKFFPENKKIDRIIRISGCRPGRPLD